MRGRGQATLTLLNGKPLTEQTVGMRPKIKRNICGPDSIESIWEAGKSVFGYIICRNVSSTFVNK